MVGPELFNELKEENPSDYSRSEASRAKEEEPRNDTPSSLPFSDPSPPGSARPPLPTASEPTPRKRKKDSVSTELLPVYHEIEAKLQEAAKQCGITWQFGKEGRALAELVQAYSKRPAELGPVVETWIDLTASGDRFYGAQPPTASALHSLLAKVEAIHAKRRPKASPSTVRVCPVCGDSLPQGAFRCPTCSTLAEDFTDPEAVASARLRLEAKV